VLGLSAEEKRKEKEASERRIHNFTGGSEGGGVSTSLNAIAQQEIPTRLCLEHARHITRTHAPADFVQNAHKRRVVLPKNAHLNITTCIMINKMYNDKQNV
jgi:hypothetical protein